MNIKYKISIFFFLCSAFLSAFLTFSGYLNQGAADIVFIFYFIGIWYYAPVIISLIMSYLINEEKNEVTKQEYIIADKILNVISVLYLIGITYIYMKLLS